MVPLDSCTKSSFLTHKGRKQFQPKPKADGDRMAENESEVTEPTLLNSAGERLRAARLAKGMELAQVAAETRIPQRHLVTIEEGDFSALPSRTYAIGFARTYAKAVGEEENAIVTLVRDELAIAGEDAEAKRAPTFEPGDPARVPSRGLALMSLLAAVLLIVGGYTSYRTYFAPGMGPAPLQDDPVQIADNSSATEGDQMQDDVPSAGPQPVTFTSEEDGTWVKFYDANGERLFEAQMAAGDSYTIPADANGPQIWTGRPYALAITVGGVSVPKLSETDEVIKDVPVTAEALRTRRTVPGQSEIIDAT